MFALYEPTRIIAYAYAHTLHIHRIHQNLRWDGGDQNPLPYPALHGGA